VYLHSRWIGAARHSGRVSFLPILQQVGGRLGFESASDADLLYAGLPKSVLQAGKSPSQNPVETDIGVLFLGEANYPKRLLDLPKPPPVLWLRGNRCLLDSSGLAVVGARSCTPYGKSIAGQLGQMEAVARGVLISGAARGIDTCAHRGAMKVGRTIAVLGAGLNAVLSGSKKRLLDEILDAGGLVLSEFPLDDPPSRWTFPQRNRVVAALGRATVVVEAASRSGAKITAGFARDLGREVFAIPGRIDAPASRGCNELILEGARPLVRLSEAVLERNCVSKGELPLVLRHLQSGPLSSGELSKRTGMNPQSLSEEIGRMELYGLLKRKPGGRFGLS
jgi:DNA processing protein